MGAVVLCEFPAAEGEARSWLLARVSVLTIKGEASLKFVATDSGAEGDARVIAIGFASLEWAGEILSRWRREDGFPAGLSIRLLQVEAVPGAGYLGFGLDHS